MSLVNRIQNLCKTNNISLSRLGLVLGFGKSSISRWDTNIPAADKLQAVADHFNVSLDYLMGRTADPRMRDGDDIFINLTDDERAALEAFLKAYREQKNKN